MPVNWRGLIVQQDLPTILRMWDTHRPTLNKVDWRQLPTSVNLAGMIERDPIQGFNARKGLGDRPHFQQAECDFRDGHFP